MSQQEVGPENKASTNMPHLIINKLSVVIYLYSTEGTPLYVLEPSGEAVKVVNFQQLIAPPEPSKRKYREVGHVPVAYSATEAGQEVIKDYLVPVVEPSFLIPRSLAVSGALLGLPAAIPPSIVYQPRWYLVEEDAARLARREGRCDVLTWDPSTLLFDEGHGKGVCRFVQW